MAAKQDDLPTRARRRAEWLRRQYEGVVRTTPDLLDELAERIEELENAYGNTLLEIGRLQERLKREM